MGVSLSDHLAGTFAAYGVLAALMARNTSGRGQKVETSLLVSVVANLVRMSATPPRVDTAAPDLGAHNGEFLRE